MNESIKRKTKLAELQEVISKGKLKVKKRTKNNKKMNKRMK
jgi:hypothetical protein